MLKKAAALFLVGAGVATWVACGSTSSHYVYATIPQANQVLAYREDPNSGVLTPLPGSPFTAGTGAEAAVLHPSKKFLYVANSGENTISLFTFASDGALTEITPRTQLSPNSSVPSLLAMDAGGGFLYVAGSGSSDISVFTIDSSGALAPVLGSPFPIGTQPLNMKLSTSGSFLYVSGGAGSAGVIEVFSISAGVLTAIGGAATDGTSPFGLEIDPAGNFLYAANTGSNSIAEFSIGSDGLLTPLSGSPLGGALLAPTALLIDPSGKFLYVASNTTSGTLAAYTIDTGGGLTVLSNSPFTAGGTPQSLAADPSGKYLLVGTQGSSAQIHVFGLSAGDGTLSSLPAYSTGNTPTSIVVMQ